MSFAIGLLLLLSSFLAETYANDHLSRSSFPPDFIFGAGSSSYQNEGATNVDGKGQSNWDFYTQRYPNIVVDGSNGEVANDFYHRYKEDIKLMKKIGVDSFRFSISWTRILPKGNKAGGVNQRGIDFYNDLIDELLANDIEPFVTLYHWDIPRALEERYGGFLSPNIVGDFIEFADICFEKFGDRVKYWVTVNEPNINAQMGYAEGVHVPNRCTRTTRSPPCTGGDSATEPYLVAHHLLLSHAAAVRLYKHKYQAHQRGKIGISVACDWVEPYDDQPSSRHAAERLYEHFCGWIFNPVTFGEYPKSMRTLVGQRLPEFTMEQSKMLRRSYDFLGLNSYSALYAFDRLPTMQHYDQDSHSAATFWDKNNQTLGKPTQIAWIFDYPEGLEKLLLRLKEKYEDPIIFITENGYSTGDQPNTSYSLRYYRKDTQRIDYLQGHLSSLLKAIKNGAKLKGYFVWSFLDDFEWNQGYLDKFGLIYVDRKKNLKRIVKDSGKWYKKLLHSKRVEHQPLLLNTCVHCSTQFKRHWS